MNAVSLSARLLGLLVIVQYRIVINTAYGQSPEILTGPVDVVAPWGSEIIFTCIGQGTVVWEVRSSQVRSSTVRNAFLALRNLSIPLPQENMSQITGFAAPENNGTDILCVVEIGINSVQSDPVLLITFGSPDPPSNLLITPSGLNLNLQWSAATSIPGEDVHYVVTARNDRTGDSQSFMVTNTSFVFDQPISDHQCDMYTFTVESKNAFGRSETNISGSHILPIAPPTTSSATSSTTSQESTATTDLTITIIASVIGGLVVFIIMIVTVVAVILCCSKYKHTIAVTVETDAVPKLGPGSYNMTTSPAYGSVHVPKLGSGSYNMTTSPAYGDIERNDQDYEVTTSPFVQLAKHVEVIAPSDDYEEVIAPSDDYEEVIAPSDDYLEVIAPTDDYLEVIAPSDNAGVVTP